MKYTLLLFIGLLFFSSCNRENISNNYSELGLILDQSISVNNQERFYHILIPPIPKDAPVVFLFHGHTSNYNEYIGISGETAPTKVWLDIAFEENIILVIADGLPTSNNEKGWNDCRSDAATNSMADDVTFVSLLIDDIVENYEADPKRVFANGISNGGHLCIRLAQEIPEKITAFAAIVAANSSKSECFESDVPVSALFMNATLDSFLPFDGGQMSSNRGAVFSTDSTINYWVSRNKTNFSPIITDLPNINTEDNCTVEKSFYSNGTNNTEVVLYKIIDGGHNEPSIEERYNSIVLGILGNQNGDIEMADEVWGFFKNKSK